MWWLDALPADPKAAVNKLGPHPEEGRFARVSKDGCRAPEVGPARLRHEDRRNRQQPISVARRHPSRRALWALLRMRSEFFRRLECEHTFMSLSRRRAAISFTMAAVLAAVSPVCAHAQDSGEAFYNGRQINLIVGYGPGGGYDLPGRLLEPRLGRGLP